MARAQPFPSKKEGTWKLVPAEIFHGCLCTVMADSALWRARWCLLGRSEALSDL